MIANPAVVWILGTYVAFGPNVPQQLAPYQGAPKVEFSTQKECVAVANALANHVKWPVVVACQAADKL